MIGGYLFAGLLSVVIILIGVFLKEREARIFSSVFSVLAVLASILYEASVGRVFGFWFSIHLILSIATIGSVIIAANDVRKDVSRFETYPLLTISFCGALFAVYSSNIITAYLGLELISICGFVLVSLNRSSSKSNESGMKYFLLGAVSSCLMIYGISLIYGFLGGNLNFRAVPYEILETNKLPLTIGVLLFSFGIFFKTTTFPFHIWAPDVYRGTNIPALSFISIVPKIAGFCLLFKVFMMISGVGFAPNMVPNISGQTFIKEIFTIVCYALSAISMLVGAFAALRQTSIKRILAYSGITHMGFVLAVFTAGTTTIIWNIVYYFLIYCLINVGIFGVISSLQRNPIYSGKLSDLNGIYKTNPVLSFSLAVLMFSSAGIPPLAGFFIKYSILKALMVQGNYVLSVIGVIASVVSSFYYLRIIKTMYFDEPSEEFKSHANNKISIFVTFLVFLSVSANLLFVSS